jgi:hypothetical protein
MKTLLGSEGVSKTILDVSPFETNFPGICLFKQYIFQDVSVSGIVSSTMY